MDTGRLTIEDLGEARLRGKRVLVRVDFNVPVDSGQVADDTRIRATLPTLESLVQKGAGLILMSHLGRPGGERKPDLSLRPVAERLGELLDAPIRFVPELVGPEVDDAVEELGGGEVLLLENTRFHPGEKANDRELSERLAELADVYVNDAFGSAHRAHASTAGVAEAMKKRGRPAVAGLLMEKELRFLGGALEAPAPPFVAILGGAKISGKIDVIENLLPKVDDLLVGGAMANTFFRALGFDTGASLVEEDRVDMARELLDRAEGKLALPTDCVVADMAREDAVTETVDRDAVAEGKKILDIGPESVQDFAARIASAQTIVWNGPMGMFEVAPFREGTLELARAVAEATDRGATTIIGGGDTAAAVEQAGLTDRMTHVSTGGGASLEFLEGRTLPGVAALNEAGSHHG